jgi:hypothetical protein
MPKRIQRQRTKGWQKPVGCKCVDRSTRWGNPFRVGRSYHAATLGGDPWSFPPVVDAHHAVALFREALSLPDRANFVLAIKRELAGHDLACWCPIDKPCHADVLLEIANEPEAQR